MEELKHIAAWVKQQYPEGYLLTWLLTQPGLWWCDGELYQSALLKDGDRLKNYVQKKEQSEIITGITEKLVQDQSLEAVAASLTRIFEVYQEELAKLQDQRRQREIRQRESTSSKTWSIPVEVSQVPSAPYADTLIGTET